MSEHDGLSLTLSRWNTNFFCTSFAAFNEQADVLLHPTTFCNNFRTGLYLFLFATVDQAPPLSLPSLVSTSTSPSMILSLSTRLIGSVGESVQGESTSAWETWLPLILGFLPPP